MCAGRVFERNMGQLKLTTKLCDCCNERLKKEMPEIEELLACFEYMCKYFWTEMGWEHFRSEFLAAGDKEYEKAHLDNAKQIAQMIASCEGRWTKIKPLIEAMK